MDSGLGGCVAGHFIHQPVFDRHISRQDNPHRPPRRKNKPNIRELSMDEMTSDFEAQRFALMQAVSEQVILPSQLKALCINKMMSDRHGQLPILSLT
jgi:hypothetical protein